jgi:hypothetical protein
MGDWLEDTLDAAMYTHAKLKDARTAPKLVAQELRALALGTTDLADELIEDLKRAGRAARVADAGGAAARGASIPPSCNTGGKVPKGKTS